MTLLSTTNACGYELVRASKIQLAERDLVPNFCSCCFANPSNCIITNYIDEVRTSPDFHGEMTTF